MPVAVPVFGAVVATVPGVAAAVVGFAAAVVGVAAAGALVAVGDGAGEHAATITPAAATLRLARNDRLEMNFDAIVAFTFPLAWLG